MMMIKTFAAQRNPVALALLLMVLLLCPWLSSTTNAADEIMVFVDEEELMMDVPPLIMEGRTLVPLRAVSEAVGCKVDWFGEERRIVVYSPAGGDPLVVMYINDRNVTINNINGATGESRESTTVSIDAPPVIINGRTMVPLRFVAETIGFEVEWNSSTQTVYLYSALYEKGRGDLVPDDVLDARIVMMVQEYLGDNIAEIPYIEYDEADGGVSLEIDAINRSLNQGIASRYQEFIESADEMYWMEIKSYPFTSEQLLQVVVTWCEYPNYGTDGNIFSVNYDRYADLWIDVETVLELLGLDQEAVREEVERLYEPETDSQSVGEVVVSGFLVREGASGPFIQLLLEIEIENSEAEPWNYFYTYIPDFDELYPLNNYCLFDPYDMDWMDPPLFYQQHAE